jgi:hypothetical protein
MSHLLMSCAFYRLVWFSVMSQFGVQEITPSTTDAVNSWLLTAAARTRAKAKGIMLLIANCIDSGESGIKDMPAFSIARDQFQPVVEGSCQKSSFGSWQE